jgi:hypothetical protein
MLWICPEINSVFRRGEPCVRPVGETVFTFPNREVIFGQFLWMVRLGTLFQIIVPNSTLSRVEKLQSSMGLELREQKTPPFNTVAFGW